MNTVDANDARILYNPPEAWVAGNATTCDGGADKTTSRYTRLFAYHIPLEPPGQALAHRRVGRPAASEQQEQDAGVQ